MNKPSISNDKTKVKLQLNLIQKKNN